MNEIDFNADNYFQKQFEIDDVPFNEIRELLENLIFKPKNEKEAQRSAQAFAETIATSPNLVWDILKEVGSDFTPGRERPLIQTLFYSLYEAAHQTIYKIDNENISNDVSMQNEANVVIDISEDQLAEFYHAPNKERDKGVGKNAEEEKLAAVRQKLQQQMFISRRNKAMRNKLQEMDSALEVPF